eukprot:maker-scaffold_6-snap-gene-1.39-mRNA-1 protein AED:0.16 eAED:0.16 QI:0/0/0/0.5/1/1/4/0/414
MNEFLKKIKGTRLARAKIRKSDLGMPEILFKTVYKLDETEGMRYNKPRVVPEVECILVYDNNLFSLHGEVREPSIEDKLLISLFNFYQIHKQVPRESQLKAKLENNTYIRKEKIEKYYEIDNWKLIDSGSNGQVYFCRNKQTNFEVAIKKVPLKKNFKKEKIETEIGYMNISKHKNIINLIECFHPKGRNTAYYLVLELMDEGSIRTIISPRIVWPEHVICFVLKECLKGLEYLHSNYIIHRDLKSGNVMHNSRGEIKLGDFGFAVGLNETEFYRESRKGSPIAPEVLRAEKYGLKIDIWSFGVFGIELADSFPPNFGKEKVALLQEIAYGPPPTLLDEKTRSKEFIHLIKICLQKVPSLRPTAKFVLLHSFFNLLNGKDAEKGFQKEDFLNFVEDFKRLENELKVQHSLPISL